MKNFFNTQIKPSLDKLESLLDENNEEVNKVEEETEVINE